MSRVHSVEQGLSPRFYHDRMNWSRDVWAAQSISFTLCKRLPVKILAPGTWSAFPRSSSTHLSRYVLELANLSDPHNFCHPFVCFSCQIVIRLKNIGRNLFCSLAYIDHLKPIFGQYKICLYQHIIYIYIYIGIFLFLQPPQLQLISSGS